MLTGDALPTCLGFLDGAQPFVFVATIVPLSHRRCGTAAVRLTSVSGVTSRWVEGRCERTDLLSTTPYPGHAGPPAGRQVEADLVL